MFCDISQTDSLAYIPILRWFIILFAIFYVLVFTKIVYNIIIIYKLRYNLYNYCIICFFNISWKLNELIESVYLETKLENNILLNLMCNVVMLNKVVLQRNKKEEFYYNI